MNTASCSARCGLQTLISNGMRFFSGEINAFFLCVQAFKFKGSLKTTSEKPLVIVALKLWGVWVMLFSILSFYLNLLKVNCYCN